MNFGKYIFSVLYYATLSMYRIRLETRYEAPFITFALLNAVYVSVWDLAMDWSLGNAYAKHPLLREVLAFRRVWVYYVAMVLDVIVRFNWIFYAIFATDLQHSAVLSFVICFSEVCRRCMWMVFRVENEHCTNVLLFRASRDTPLPYKLPTSEEEQAAEEQQQPQPEPDRPQQQQRLQEEQEEAAVQQAVSDAPITGDIEQGGQLPQPPTPAGASVRSRRASRAAAAAAGLSRVGSIVAAAHAQDFERRKQPKPSPGAVQENDQSLEDSSDDDSADGQDGDDGDVDVDAIENAVEDDDDDDDKGESEMATGRISEEHT